jgi:hypothetical protein
MIHRSNYTTLTSTGHLSSKVRHIIQISIPRQAYGVSSVHIMLTNCLSLSNQSSGKSRSDAASRVCTQISIPRWAYGVSLVHEFVIHCLLLTKFSQAEKVGQIQHPHLAIKSASKSDQCLHHYKYVYKWIAPERLTRYGHKCRSKFKVMEVRCSIWRMNSIEHPKISKWLNF